MSMKKSIHTAQKVGRQIEKAQRVDHRANEAFTRVEAQMRKKPISTLGLTYTPSMGIDSGTIDIKTAGGTMTYGPARAAPTALKVDPPSEKVGDVAVRPLDLFVNDWATIVPLEVSNTSEEFRPTVNWVKKTERSSSAIFLLDPEHSEYYYPVETDFTGEVLAGHPRSGLFGFEPFRRPTSRVELHLSGVKLGPARSAASNLKFQMSRPNLRDEIEKAVSGPGVTEGLRQSYAAQTGCALAGLVLIGPGLLGLIAVLTT